MKKIITLIMAVCMLAGVMGISALAADEYTGPVTHQIPAIVDFETETAGQYYGATAKPKTFYNLASFNFIVNDEEASNKYLNFRPGANVNGKVAIKFSDFVYDETAALTGAQPTKLVISFDSYYTKIMKSAGNLGLFGTYDHILIGTASDDLGIQAGSVGNNVFAMYYPITDVENSDVDKIGNIGYRLGGSNHNFAASALNNHSYKNTIDNGELVTYTFVIDLTQDANGKCNVTMYINDATTGKLTHEGSTSIGKVNAISIVTSRNNEMIVDNVRAYTVANEAIAVEGTDLPMTDAPVSADGVTINFNHEVIAAADRYITVMKGDEELTNGIDYTLEPVYGTTGAKTAKSLKVKFTDPLSYSTSYAVKASADYYGVDGIPVGEELTLASFTTEAPPQINLSALTIKKGFLGETAVASLSEALGSTVTASVTATNGEASDEAMGSVFFGVYKNGELVNLAYVNKTFDEAEIDTISVKLKMPEATASDTVEVKAFVCEGITNVAPFATPVMVSTAD